METVLLTGFAGFIGSQLLRDLLAKRYRVIGIDNLSEGSDRTNFEDIQDPNFSWIRCNIENPDLKQSIYQILNTLQINTGINYIISCAADSHVDRCYTQIDKFISSNINGPINLAKIALEFPNLKKFCQVSTDEIFGESPQPFTEDTPIKTGNAYASSKASAELFLHNYYKAFGLPLVITNGANTYGPRQANEKVIPKTIYNILKGNKVPLFKTKAMRMWLHVEDHCQAIILAMEKGIIGKKYCLAPNLENELYTHDLVHQICNILQVKFEDVVQEVLDRPNYDLRYWMLNDYAKSQLGWNPSKNIKDELKGIVEWYKFKWGSK